MCHGSRWTRGLRFLLIWLGCQDRTGLWHSINGWTPVSAKRGTQKLNAKVCAHLGNYLCLCLSPARNLADRWFVNKKSLSMGTATKARALSGIDFSQLKPDPSLHRWQQRHWCSASKRTAASCRLQDATISIHIWHVNTVADIWFCAETAQVSKRCCCRSSCQLD